jgi:hypothetical protein
MAEATKDRAPKRVALNMKATPALRARIEAAAGESGLSIAQEVERRLIESFKEEDRLGGPQSARVLYAVAANIEAAEHATGRRWLEDYATWFAVRYLIDETLYDFSPAPPNAEAITKAIQEREQSRAGLEALARDIADPPSPQQQADMLVAMKRLKEAESAIGAAYGHIEEALTEADKITAGVYHRRALAAGLRRWIKERS